MFNDGVRLPLGELGWVGEPFDVLEDGRQEGLALWVHREEFDYFTDFGGSLIPHYGDWVSAQFECHWDDVREYCAQIVYGREGGQLLGDTLPHPPLLLILLQKQKDIYELNTLMFVQNLHYLGEVLDGTQLDLVVCVIR